jgi:transposase-like protein
MGKRHTRVEFDPILTGQTRRHWSANQARTTLAAWRRSGLSLSAFARKRGVNAQRLSWWRKRLSDGEAGRGAVAFIPAVVGGTAPSVTVRLPRGVEVEAAELAAVAPKWLAELVRALERQE